MNPTYVVVYSYTDNFNKFRIERGNHWYSQDEANKEAAEIFANGSPDCWWIEKVSVMEYHG